MSDTRARDVAVDVLRGLAITSMVWGHLNVAIYHPRGEGTPSPTLEVIPPLWAEVVGGVAPVLFVMICGMMIAYRTTSGIGVQLRRMGMLLAAGVLLDVVFWQILPFTTVDILYLLGVSLPLAYLFATRLPPVMPWIIALAIIALTPLLQGWLGYSDYPSEYLLSGDLYQHVANQTGILRHWIVDGWFPMFPWLGVSFLGVLLGKYRLARPADAGFDGRLFAGGTALLMVGIALGFPFGERVVARMQAGAVFNPPTSSYVLATIGICLMLFPIVDGLPRSRAEAPLRLLGRASLFVYILHFPVVKLAAHVLPSRLALFPSLGVAGAVLLTFALVIHTRDRVIVVVRRRLGA